MGEITWKDELIRGLKHFGGEAHRKELFDYIKKTTNKNIPKKFTNTLQKELERLSKDSSNFSGVSIFYSVEGIGAGVWGINGYEPDENMDITQDDLSYPEGKEQLRKHIQKERNNKLIRDAKKCLKKKMDLYIVKYVELISKRYMEKLVETLLKHIIINVK